MLHSHVSRIFCYTRYMKTETVKAIFTNLLFVIGVILLIYGFIQGSLTAVRLLTFEKYPLANYEESRCDFDYGLPQKETGEPAVSPEAWQAEQAERRASCLESLDQARRVKQTEHIVTSITTLVSGAVLVWSFKRFIFDR